MAWGVFSYLEMTFVLGHFCRRIYYIQNCIFFLYSGNIWVSCLYKCDHYHFNWAESLYSLTTVQSTRFSSVKHTKGLNVERTDPTHESFLHRVLIAVSLRVQPVDLSLSFLELLYMLTNTMLNVQIMSTSSNLLDMESLTPKRKK